MSSNFDKPSSDPRRQEFQPESGMRADQGTTESSTYGQPRSTQSGFGGGTDEDIYGRDTSRDTSQMGSAQPGRGMTGSGAGATNMPSSNVGSNVPRTAPTTTYATPGTTQTGPQEFVTTTGVNSGAGVHAQQYKGPRSEQVDTSAGTGQRGHFGHHPAGECRQPDCATCTSTGAYATPIGGSGTSTGTAPAGQHTFGHHTSETHPTGHHTEPGLMAGSGTHAGARTGTMGSSVGSTGATTGTTGSSMAPGTHQPSTTQTTGSQTTGGHKPTMADKIMGGAEKMAGKMTGNEAMEIHGQERKAGDLPK